MEEQLTVDYPYNTKTSQEQLKEENKEPKALTRLAPVWASICEMCQEKPDRGRPHPTTNVGARHYRTPPEVLCLWLS